MTSTDPDPPPAPTVPVGGSPGDLRLAQRAAAGDQAALRAVLERVTRRLRGAAWNLCRDGHEAQDLVQEALLKLTLPEVLSRYRGDGPLDGYLLSVGVRTMISAGRSGRTRNERTVLTGEPEDRAGGGEDPEPAILSPAVHAALAELPERARAVVLLLVIGDLTLAEVARALDMEVGTVKSTYSRARAALRSQLADAELR
jgi:RNA polymerase sigma factor (sigma-70 family)